VRFPARAKMLSPTILHRFLLNSHLHAPLARAMSIALKDAKLNDKFQDPLFLFLELVRAGVMRGNLLSGRAFSGGPSFGTGERSAFLRTGGCTLTSLVPAPIR
jgi:hypothetical protein